MRHASQPSRKRFAEIVRRAFRHAGNCKSIRYDHDQFTMVIGETEGEPRRVNLANAYREYCGVPPSHRVEVLQQYVRVASMESLSISAESAVPCLVPHLHHRRFHGSHPGSISVWRGEPRLLGHHLVVGVAIDQPDFQVALGNDGLAALELTEETAYALAVGNLRNQGVAPFSSPAPGVYVSAWKDRRDASRLVLTDVIRGCEVKGDYVAAVPSQDCLIVTGSDDISGLKVMFDLIDVALRRPRPLSEIPVCLRQGKWVDLELSPSHPHYQQLRSLTLESMAKSYRRHVVQPPGLPEEARGHFMSSVMLIEGQSVKWKYSLCTWTTGAPALLPRTDAIAFMCGHFTSSFSLGAVCGWDHAQKIVGDLMTPVGLYPERYRVDRFPEPEQLAALGFDRRFAPTGQSGKAM